MINLGIAVPAFSTRFHRATLIRPGLVELMPVVIDLAQFAIQGRAKGDFLAGHFQAAQAFCGDLEGAVELASLQRHLGVTGEAQDLEGKVAGEPGISRDHLKDLGSVFIIVHLLESLCQGHVEHAANLGIHLRQNLPRLEGQIPARFWIPLRHQQLGLDRQPFAMQRW